MNTDKLRFMKVKLLLIIAIAIFFGFSCGSKAKLEQAKEIVAKVEKFKVEKDRLPNSLSEIGIIETEAGPIYYKKATESKYIVWFGKDLGESITYDSDTKKWK